MNDEACSGGIVHRRGLFVGPYNISFLPLSSSTFGWYNRQWHMLVRRLRYTGSRKAVLARKRILLHWGSAGVKEAEAEVNATAAWRPPLAGK